MNKEEMTYGEGVFATKLARMEAKNRKNGFNSVNYKIDGSIQENYDGYLKKNIRIGNMGKFPTKEVIDEIIIQTNCGGYNVQVITQYVTVTFGENNEYICKAVVTNHVDIGRRMPLGGFGSHCYFEEAQTAELAVVEMCKKHNLMICDKVNSWPYAQAIVQENRYKN